jgi:hypothetical protein
LLLQPVIVQTAHHILGQGFGCSPIKAVRELGCLILYIGVVRQFGPYLSWA